MTTAIQVPEGAPGEYEVWLALYWWQAPADRLTVTDADGAVLAITSCWRG